MDTLRLNNPALKRWISILICLALVGSWLGQSYGIAQADAPDPWLDEFDGEPLDPVWYWEYENSDTWSLTEQPGFLRIYTSSSPTGGENLLLRSVAPGDFAIQTRLIFQPDTNFQFAGLVIWQDAANFLQLGRAFCDVQDVCVDNGIYFDHLEGGSLVDGNFATSVDNPSEAYLRLIRRRSAIKAYYSGNGLDWMMIGEHILPIGFKINAVGLTSAQHYSGGDAIPADFDYFALNQVPSPFVGQWQAVDIDGGDIRLAIGGSRRGLYRITYTESYLGFCGGEAGIARGVGWLNPDDPYVLEANLLLSCFTTSDQMEMHPVWRYDPTTNWLRDRNDDFGGFITTWHRPGETLPLLWTIFITHPDQEWVEGMGFPEGTVVSLLIRDSTGVNQFAGTAVAFYPEWDPFNTTVRFELFNEGYNLKAGDQLWMSDGMVVKYHVVTVLQITGVDLPSKTVSGIAAPGSEVIIEGFPQDGDPVMFSVFANQEGHWTADVPWLTPGIDGLASQADADGDMTRVGFRAPRLDLRVNYGHDWVESFFPAGHTVQITVTDGDSNTKATAEVVTAPREEWGWQEGFQTRPEDWDPSPPDIQPNDWVLAEVVSGPYSAQDSAVQIGDISGEIDLETDSIQGTIAASWFLPEEVDVECHPWGAPDPNTPMKFDRILPDSNETYACTWDRDTEWDIMAGETVGVGYFGPDGHWVANVVPNPWLIAFPEAYQIFGYGWPQGTGVHLTINDNDPPDFTQTAIVGPAPWDPNDIMAFFDFGGSYDLMPDDVVTLSGSGINRMHTVRNLAITAVDASENTVTGTADSEAVHAWVHGFEKSYMQVPVEFYGTWLADFDDVDFDLEGGMCGRVEIRDDGNSTAVDWCIPE